MALDPLPPFGAYVINELPLSFACSAASYCHDKSAVNPLDRAVSFARTLPVHISAQLFVALTVHGGIKTTRGGR